MKTFVMNLAGASNDQINPNDVYIDTCTGCTITRKIDGCVGELHRMDATVKDWEGRPSQVHGVGTYKMITETGCSITFKDVIYIRPLAQRSSRTPS